MSLGVCNPTESAGRCSSLAQGLQTSFMGGARKRKLCTVSVPKPPPTSLKAEIICPSSLLRSTMVLLLLVLLDEFPGCPFYNNQDLPQSSSSIAFGYYLFPYQLQRLLDTLLLSFVFQWFGSTFRPNLTARFLQVRSVGLSHRVLGDQLLAYSLSQSKSSF
jgi:hypothetical protein